MSTRPSSTSAEVFFFFNDTATTEIYTLSLHDALPICDDWIVPAAETSRVTVPRWTVVVDRKSTRLNSSHVEISYAVLCLKKKKKMTCTYNGRVKLSPRNLSRKRASYQ